MDNSELSERHKRYLRLLEVREELNYQPRISKTKQDRADIFKLIRLIIKMMESSIDSNQSTTSNQSTESNDTSDSVPNRAVEPRRSERLIAAAAASAAAAQHRSTFNLQDVPEIPTTPNNSRHRPGTVRTRNGQIARPDTPRPRQRRAELLESVRQLRSQLSPESTSWSTIRGSSRSMLTHPRRNVFTPNREPNTRRCAGDTTTVQRGRHRRGNRRGGRDRLQRSRQRARPQQVRNVLLADRRSNEDVSQNPGNLLLVSRRYTNQQPARQNRRRGRHN